MKTILLMMVVALGGACASMDDGLSDEVAAARDYIESHDVGAQKPFACRWTPLPDGGSCTCCSNDSQTCCSCPTSGGCF